ncbi:MAG: amidohydrolase family protein [Candidatus Thermoplasmatota archaeon]|nr:amidohydrolase family protein [Candidatus Thermoplasmatota archaeon]
MLVENVNIASPYNKESVTGPFFDELEILEHQDINIANGKIESITPSSNPKKDSKWVIPAFCDPHTHLVFSGTRENEIDLKKTLGYAEVMKRGGGIYSTIRSTTDCDEKTLYNESRTRIVNMMKNGTAIFESKTGYGTNAEAEEKILNVIERLERDLRVRIKKTLLAHVIPRESDERTYLKEFEDMIEEFKRRIDYVDVFVDFGAFSPGFAKDAIQYANSLGIPGRVHLNELKNLNGVSELSDLDIRSFDHMIETREEELDKIQKTITILPFTAINLRKSGQIFAKMKKKGKTLAIGSDISPNTYVTSFPLVISLARQLFPFTIENLINMSTLNSCYSLSLSGSAGSLHPGKDANLIVMRENYNKLGYKFGDNLIDRVMINGRYIK